MNVTLTTCKTDKVVVIVEYTDYYGEPVLQKTESAAELLTVLTTIRKIYGSLYVKHVILQEVLNMYDVKVYIGHFYDEGLFHVYESNIENGITFFMDENLGELIKKVVRSAKETDIKIKPIVCSWKSFIMN